VNADSYNLFGHSGESTAEAFIGFTPSGSDVTATSDGGAPTALAAILLSLASNGGPTQTHALVTDSPAVDLDATCGLGMTIDQRGYARPVGFGCDAGAYEFDSTPTAAGDMDDDIIPDPVDNCMEVFNPYQEDSDGDSVGDACDNCLQASNADQKDADKDGAGDSCCGAASVTDSVNMVPIYKLLLGR
jgi:hypothetical protein